MCTPTIPPHTHQHNHTHLPQPCTTRHTQFEISPKLDTALHTQYNISQQNAIKAGLHGDGVVLIQGPPGTGKTNTILGLLSIITQAAPQGVYSGTTHGNSDHLLQHNPAKRMEIVHAASPWLAGGTAARDVARKIDMLTHTRAGGHVFGLQAPARVRHIAWDGRDRPHVLVCAPSNSALDELVWRLLQGGYVMCVGVGGVFHTFMCMFHTLCFCKCFVYFTTNACLQRGLITVYTSLHISLHIITCIALQTPHTNNHTHLTHTPKHLPNIITQVA